MVGHQEVCLAKIGGRLEIALSLNHARSPECDEKERMSLQIRFETPRTKSENWPNQLLTTRPCFPRDRQANYHCRTDSRSGKASRLTGQYRATRSTTVDQGKLCGPAPVTTLIPGSVKRAFDEWRLLCINNRMQWGLLMDRLHGANQSLSNVMNGKQ